MEQSSQIIFVEGEKVALRVPRLAQSLLARGTKPGVELPLIRSKARRQARQGGAKHSAQ
jgi:hypothetical protein